MTREYNLEFDDKWMQVTVDDGKVTFHGTPDMLHKLVVAVTHGDRDIANEIIGERGEVREMVIETPTRRLKFVRKGMDMNIYAYGDSAEELSYGRPGWLEKDLKVPGLKEQLEAFW